MARLGHWATTSAGTPRPRGDALRAALVLALLALPTLSGAALAAGPVDGAPSIGDPYFPKLGNGGYDVQHYDLSLDFDLTRRTVAGVASIELTPTVALRSLTFDLDGLKVSGVEVDGATAGFAQEAKKLRVEPAQPLAEDQPAVVRVAYSGRPQGANLLGWFWFSGGGALLSPQPSGASTLFPCNDHPLDKATFAFHLTVPQGRVAVANGILDSQTTTADGRQRFDWHEPASFPTYAAVVAVGRYRLVEGTTADGLPALNAFPKAGQKLARRVEPQGRIVSTLEQYFGPYPYSGIGAIIITKSGPDAMEAAGRPTYPGVRAALRSRGFEQLMAHEIAHQWVGDTASFTKWQDIWLSEGFATYGELLWIADSRQLPIGSLFDRGSRYFGYYQGMKRPPGDPGPSRIFNVTVYNRGAMTLEALRRTVGDEAFFQILREWVVLHRGGNATTDDFIQLAESVSGQDLDALSQRWLYESGLPQLPAEGGPPGALDPAVPESELLDDATFRGHRVDDAGNGGANGASASGKADRHGQRRANRSRRHAADGSRHEATSGSNGSEP